MKVFIHLRRQVDKNSSKPALQIQRGLLSTTTQSLLTGQIFAAHPFGTVGIGTPPKHE